jgi:hypothetical protein
MPYKTSIDDAIIKQLYKNECGFNQLFTILQNSSLTSSRTTLSRHLTRMQRLQIIERKQEIGKSSEIKLSNDSRQEIKLRIYRGSYFKKRKKQKLNDEEKIRNAIQLILSVAAGRSSFFKEVSKPQPGDIAVPISEDLSKGFRSFSLESKDGFALSDLMNQLWVGANAGTFRDTNLLPPDLERILDILKEQSIIRPTSIGENPRYGILDDNLCDFINDCQSLFSTVLMRMQKTWICRKPTHDEVEWISLFFGRKQVINLFMNANKMRTSINTKSKSIKIEEKTNIKREITKFDKMITAQWDKINVRKMKLEHSVFSKIFIETIYPKFLQRLLE